MRFVDILKHIDGYERSDAREGKKFISKSIAGSLAGKQTNKQLRLLFSVTARLKTVLSYTSTRFYGLFLLSFGLSILFLHFAMDYLGLYDSVPLGVLITSTASAILGVLVVVFDKPLTVFLQDFKLTDYILYEFFCIKRSYKRSDLKGIPAIVGFFIGVILAALTAVVPFWYVFYAVIGVVYVYVALLSPEFSLFSTFLVLPYLSLMDRHEILLAAFVAINLISFIRKVVLGKRVFYLEQYDVCLFVFLLFILISGIFVKGIESFKSSVVMIILAAGYTLSSCIIANRRLADCLISALITSSVPVSIMAIVQFILFFTSSPVSDFQGVSATFSSPAVLAGFLLLSYVFSLYMLRSGLSVAKRAVYGLVTSVTLIALVLTYNVWAIVVAILIVPIYILLQSVRPFVVALVFLSLLPSALAIIPVSSLEGLLDIEWLAPLNLNQLVSRWGLGKSMFLNNVFTGIGIGEDCFAAELFGLTGELLDFTDASHFLLEIAIEAGVFAICAFLIILIIRIRHTGMYLSYTRNSQLGKLAPFGTLALSSLLLFGAANYLWADMSMYFLYWCVFGIGTATLRISRQEYDDRMGYYSDGRSAEASSIDVEIK